jgi:hypothetical protein
VLFVNGTHERCCGWQDLVDEDKDRLLRCELDTFANDINKLTNGQILSEYIDQDTPSTSIIAKDERTDGTRYFFLSIVGISVRSAFSQITCFDCATMLEIGILAGTES